MNAGVCLRSAGVALLALLTVGCHDDKDLGPPALFPPNATKLYFADCDPFTPDQESTDLVPDAADACAGDVRFYPYLTARWSSNTMRAPTGSFYEGVYLVFERDMSWAGDSAALSITFEGIAVQFTEQFHLPVGETRSVWEHYEQGTVVYPADSLVRISVALTAMSGQVRLVLGPHTGSYVITGVNEANLCRFEIDLGLAAGIGRPGVGMNYSYQSTSGPVTASLAWDFTGGASLLDGPVLLLGPRYGVVYLAAESGGCRDTASFWAPPGSPYHDDTVASFTSEHYSRNFVSDGVTAWMWGVVSEPGDTVTPWRVKVVYRTEWPLISHPVPTSCCEVQYDGTRDLIWIIARGTLAGDSAWGYTTGGVLDSAIGFRGIPYEGMYRGQWLRTTQTSVFLRSAELVPLGGGAATSIGSFPIETTREFRGGAGIGYPGVAGYDLWSVNAFDSLGNWVGRFPISIPSGDAPSSVHILSADHLIVCQVKTSDYRVYIRAVRPD